jgi:hypothetical protein
VFDSKQKPMSMWAVTLKRILDQGVKLNGKSGRRRGTYLDAVITQVVNNAVAGDDRAVDQIIRLLRAVPIEHEDGTRGSLEEFLRIVRVWYGLDEPTEEDLR